MDKPDAIAAMPFEVARGFLKEWVPGYSPEQAASLGKLLARFSGLSTEEAAALPAMPPALEPVHVSHLAHMSESPAHYLAALQNKADTPSLKFGRLVHSIVLGGHYVVFDGERRGNRWKDFKAEHAGAEIVTSKEYEEATPVAQAVLAHPLAAPLLAGDKEVLIEWEFAGRRCSSRLDVVGRDFITDLKTADCSEPGRFVRQGTRLHYPAKMAFYQAAARSAGFLANDVYLVAVETEAPYAVTVLRITPSTLEQGLRIARGWMEKLLICEASNQWPAYVQSIVDFDLVEPLTLIIEGQEVRM